jgi:drug/metabolite transporter (DMT)-like permease
MRPLLLALALATVGNVLYHLAQKLVPSTVRPMAMLMVAYAVAFLLSGLALVLWQPAGQPLRQAFVGLGSGPGLKVALVLGLGVLLIEAGFLLAYRAGGSLQWSGLAVNGLSALVLLPLAVGLFRESFSLPKVLGMALVLGGLVLLTRR